MKKWLWTLAVVGLLNPVFADVKDSDHEDKEASAKSSESASGERAKKESVQTDDLAQKINACLNGRPDEKSK